MTATTTTRTSISTWDDYTTRNTTKLYEPKRSWSTKRSVRWGCKKMPTAFLIMFRFTNFDICWTIFFFGVLEFQLYWAPTRAHTHVRTRTHTNNAGVGQATNNGNNCDTRARTNNWNDEIETENETQPTTPTLWRRRGAKRARSAHSQSFAKRESARLCSADAFCLSNGTILTYLLQPRVSWRCQHVQIKRQP